MRLRAQLGLLAVMAGLEGWLCRHDSRRAGAAGPAFVDQPLLAPEAIDRARRIVIREKPQARVVSRGEGFEVRIVPDKDAPIRETVLERRDGGRWAVANCFDLDADPAWLGQTMRDLSQGRLVRFVARDPKLMDDLDLDDAQVRLEDGEGRTIRRLDFGRKDGGNAYQFVRVDGGDAFVARHGADIVGDPPSWIANRVLQFGPADVREVELSFPDAREAPLELARDARDAPLLTRGPGSPAPERAGRNVERLVAGLLAERVMLVVDRNSPAVAEARRRMTARLRLKLFDGREYGIAYAVLPKSDPSAAGLKGYDDRNMAFGFYECGDPNDLVARYGARAALIYNRNATIGRWPKSREDLAAPEAAR